MGSAEEEKAGQLEEEEDIEEEEEEGKKKKKKKKGMCAKLLKFFASLGGQYDLVRFYNLLFMFSLGVHCHCAYNIQFILLMVKIISPGLFILLLLYIVGGAELFILLEAPKEEEAKMVKYN